MQHEPTRKTAGGRQFGAAIWCVGQNVTSALHSANVHSSDDGVILNEPLVTVTRGSVKTLLSLINFVKIYC